MPKLQIGGLTILVDSVDVRRVLRQNWSVQRSPHFSIRTTIKGLKGKLRKITLQRYLMGVNCGGIVVQRDRQSPLDFRRRNLLVCSMSERQSSLGKRSSRSSSKYKGVSLNKKGGTWRASIRPHGRSIFIGDFQTEKEAARAYNEAAAKYFGPTAFLNEVGA